MHLLREITISGFTGDADWVGDEDAVELADSAFLKMSGGWTDVQWVLLYTDTNGNKIGADAGTFNAQVTFRQQTAQGVDDGAAENKYWRGATQSSVNAGVLQNGDAQFGGRTRRPEVELTVRITGALTAPPALAVRAQIYAQEV